MPDFKAPITLNGVHVSLDTHDHSSAPWQTVGLWINWSNYNATFGGVVYNDFGFWKDTGGVVHLRGFMWAMSGNTGRTIAMLPAGYRPLRREVQVGATGVTIATGTRIDVAPTGEIQVIDASVSGAWFSLDSISFRAA